ncbi:ribokinase [Arthrobacter pigmenti]|uniref:Ribokinase n=1 Tax=Arthrobacter pigmenti TaxID=271432 RepID=A0A846RNL7_9MICC|nr:ribokinase [Arthrobacter pigmenti]
MTAQEANAQFKVVVVGQVARDLVLQIERMPDDGGSVPVQKRQELLGGKGANQGVACRRLGADVSLVGVLGDDQAGHTVLAQVAADGMDVNGVVIRDGAPTALLLDIVQPDGVRRLFEDVDSRVLLEAGDVRASEDLLRSANAVLIQLQQPAAAVTAALDAADPDALVVTDGAPPDNQTRERVLRRAVVVRADVEETEALVGWKPADLTETIEAAQKLLEEGPRVVALASPTGGNVVAWPGGHVVLPFIEEEPVDPTGAGDAFVAALTVGLLHGQDPETAAWWAAVAAARVVGKAGGRPELDLDEIRQAAANARRR